MPLDALNDPEHLYFITASLVNWLPLFSNRNYTMIVFDYLDWLRIKKRILLFAFVVMPSHLHLLTKPVNESIGKKLQTFGSFTAHQIIKQLKKENRIDILNIFHEQRRDKRSRHSVWQEIHTENVFSEIFRFRKWNTFTVTPWTQNGIWSITELNITIHPPLIMIRGNHQSSKLMTFIII